MAIAKKAKAEAEKSANLNIEVSRVKDFSDEKVNGVTIYGCYYREGVKDGKDYSMVAFPSRKSSDGKYYKHAYVKLSDADIDNISKQIEALL